MINEEGKITFKGDRLNLIFNKNRGLALESFIDKNYFDNSLFGTLRHGYYNNISYSPDFYSGNLIFDIPEKHKLTDLNKINPIIENEKSKVIIKSFQNLSKIDVKKIWTIDDNNGVVNLNLKLHFKNNFLSTIRINAITLNPESFNIKNLFFAVKNGGTDYERFFLKEFKNIDYSHPLSLLISARTAIGITDGNLLIGDHSNTLKINIDKTKSALVGLIKHEKLNDSYFTRAILTAREIDDTSKTENLEDLEFDINFSVCKTEIIFNMINKNQYTVLSQIIESKYQNIIKFNPLIYNTINLQLRLDEVGEGRLVDKNLKKVSKRYQLFSCITKLFFQIYLRLRFSNNKKKVFFIRTNTF